MRSGSHRSWFVTTATLGYVVGYLFALPWNRLSSEKAL